MFVIQNVSCKNMYVSKTPGEYSNLKNAKEFKNKEFALMVASLLTVAGQGKFEIIPVKGE